MADAMVTTNTGDRFERLLSPAVAWRTLNVEEDDGQEHLIAFLERGFVRLELIGLVEGDAWTTCYDVYVKTGAESEWVFYESIHKWCGEVFDGDLYGEMKTVLEDCLQENEWDSSDIRFPVKKGIGTEENIKKERNNGRIESPAPNLTGTASGVL